MLLLLLLGVTVHLHPALQHQQGSRSCLQMALLLLAPLLLLLLLLLVGVPAAHQCWLCP
jgi:hypothetical protein